MEIWHVLLICVLMIPLFFLANYLVVTRMARDRRLRDRKIELHAAKSVGENYLEGRTRFVTKRYRPRKPGGGT